ncbi:MAG: hypothetical protein LJE68_18870, partial [Rhodobacter sp.]|nr:hypothetical protein [Rhodobacter sp.]
QRLGRNGLIPVGLCKDHYLRIAVIHEARGKSQLSADFVYFDALIPQDGQSAFDLMPGVEESFRKRMHDAGSEYLVPPLSPEVMGVTAPGDVAWMLDHLTPMPIKTHAEKVVAPEGKAAAIPSSYIRCLQFSLGASYAAWAETQGWPVFEIDTGHDAMLTEPEILADLIERAVS